MRFFFLLLISFNFSPLFGQSTGTDSLAAKKAIERIERRVVQDRGISEPAKAAMLAAALPGAGQIYTKKYWKLPIVYGGAVAFGMVIKFNHDEYVEVRNVLAARTDGDPSTLEDPLFEQATNDGLRSIREDYRRNRDYAIILATIFYGLQILDATVSAHLQDFDVSDDLSFKLEPTLLPIQQFGSGLAVGMKVTATF